MHPALADPLVIDRLAGVDSMGKLTDGPVTVGLDGRIAVVLKGDIPATLPSEAVLVLNGRMITGLKDTTYSPNDHALIFRLERNSDNAAAWEPLLKSPTLQSR